MNTQPPPWSQSLEGYKQYTNVMWIQWKISSSCGRVKYHWRLYKMVTNDKIQNLPDSQLFQEQNGGRWFYNNYVNKSPEIIPGEALDFNNGRMISGIDSRLQMSFDKIPTSKNKTMMMISQSPSDLDKDSPYYVHVGIQVSGNRTFCGVFLFSQGIYVSSNRPFNVNDHNMLSTVD